MFALLACCRLLQSIEAESSQTQLKLMQDQLDWERFRQDEKSALEALKLRIAHRESQVQAAEQV